MLRPRHNNVFGIKIALDKAGRTFLLPYALVFLKE